MSPGDVVTIRPETFGYRDLEGPSMVEGAFLPTGMICLVLKSDADIAEVLGADQFIWFVSCSDLNLVRRKR
jgi:hypothetical protein